MIIQAPYWVADSNRWSFFASATHDGKPRAMRICTTQMLAAFAHKMVRGSRVLLDGEVTNTRKNLVTVASQFPLVGTGFVMEASNIRLSDGIICDTGAPSELPVSYSDAIAINGLIPTWHSKQVPNLRVPLKLFRNPCRHHFRVNRGRHDQRVQRFHRGAQQRQDHSGAPQPRPRRRSAKTLAVHRVGSDRPYQGRWFVFNCYLVQLHPSIFRRLTGNVRRLEACRIPQRQRGLLHFRAILPNNFQVAIATTKSPVLADDNLPKATSIASLTASAANSAETDKENFLNTSDSSTETVGENVRKLLIHAIYESL